jgi:hypothetical protein
MRIIGEKNDCKAWLSARDTENWANRPGSSWPCSTVSGKRIMVEVSHGDLVDIWINGKWGECSGYELDAILLDFGIRG